LLLSEDAIVLTNGLTQLFVLLEKTLVENMGELDLRAGLKATVLDVKLELDFGDGLLLTDC
jgi:hypothetical protein